MQERECEEDSDGEVGEAANALIYRVSMFDQDVLMFIPHQHNVGQF